MRLIALMIGVGLLAGCATAPKPVLAPHEYTGVARGWVGWNRCISTGAVSPEIGALGIRYVKGELTNRAYDQRLLDQEVQKASQEMPDADLRFCNSFATQVAGHKQQIDINNAAVSRQQQELQNVLNNIPKPVYCNTVGGVTMCN
ncbi:hypothetical protein [Stutzerimonas kunmingensis]|jgi:hypothetical protein|uniref:hypothetical protein n=1 Tax=Stutzerimonas kunmingensis TaxID=1211807 RepID=UPI0028A64B9D|nr:hypothetical protein [Stutzerimonas kunmingensis]